MAQEKKQQQQLGQLDKDKVFHLQESPSVNVHRLQLLFQGGVPGPLFEKLLLEVEQFPPEAKTWFSTFSSL